MQILRPSDKSYQRRLLDLNRRFASDPAVKGSVEEILSAVAKEGDAALLRYTKKFGGPDLEARGIPVTPQEVASALAELPAETAKAIQAAKANVKAFAKRSLKKVGS